MNSNAIPLIVIACILAVIIIVYLKFNKYKDVIILLLIILQIISLFFVYFSNCSNEGFETLDEQYAPKNLFQVSPQRKQCLVEQVSLQQPPATRSCNCCCVGTVGGNLKYVEQWKTPNDSNNWHRTDNWTRNKNNNAFKTQLAPTSLL